jgi:Ni,Fe-hydrogenase III small subunit/ferredoxin
MLKILLSRIRQGHHTNRYPKQAPALPLRFRGLPKLSADHCLSKCRACEEACPTGAISKSKNVMDKSGRPLLSMDLGRCLFCASCMEICPEHSIAFTRDHRLAARERGDLLLSQENSLTPAAPLDETLHKLFSKSLSIRVVSAGGCNGCEVDVNVLQTIAWDIKRFGIDFTAAPRHADALLICGPITQNMRLAVQKTVDAAPSPKLTIAVGACAISGGMYASLPQQCGGCQGIGLKPDLLVPGCPPHPLTILDGLLRLIGKAP